MASIPLVSGRSVATERGPLATQSPDVPLAAFGGATAAAQAQSGVDMQQAGNQLFAAGQRLQREDDTREHSKLDTELAAFIGKIGYGSGEGEDTGFYGSQGENAIGKYKTANEAIRAKAAELAANSSNERVRQMFQVSSGARITQEDTRYLSHVTTERKKANIAVADAAMSQATNDAVAAYNDRGVLERSLVVAEIQTDIVGNQIGADPTVKAKMMKDAQSDIIKATFDMAIKNENTSVAQRILRENADRINAKQQTEMAGALKGAVDLQKAQSATDKIFQSAFTDAEKMAAARAIPDPQVRQRVEQMVSTRMAQDRQIDANMKSDAYQNAATAVQNGSTFEEWSDRNPAMKTLLDKDPEASNRIRAAQKAFQEGRLYAPASDGVTAVRLEAKTTDELSTLSENDVLSYRPLLTKTEYDRFYQQWGAALQSTDKQTKSWAVYRRGEELLSKLAPPELQWSSNDASATQKVAKTRAINQLNTFIDTQIKQGKTPTNDMLVSEINNMFIPVRRQGMFGVGQYLTTDADFAFELNYMKPKERETYRVPMDKVLPEVQQELRYKLRSLGINEPSDDFLEQMMGAQVTNNRERQNKLITDEMKKR
jgi:hypothetical protein